MKKRNIDLSFMLDKPFLSIGNDLFVHPRKYVEFEGLVLFSRRTPANVSASEFVDVDFLISHSKVSDFFFWLGFRPRPVDTTIKCGELIETERACWWLWDWIGHFTWVTYIHFIQMPNEWFAEPGQRIEVSGILCDIYQRDWGFKQLAETSLRLATNRCPFIYPISFKYSQK